MQPIIKRYYRLAKPGIVYGNLLTAAGGFLLASTGDVDLLPLIAVLIGIGGVMASACVLNNYIDQDIDAKMTRTKQRALVIHSISERSALIYGAILGIIGFGFLGAYTNRLTIVLGIIAYITYLLLYGVAKRKSVHGTLVGAISGALPPVAGYTAVADVFDSTALLLFLILACWQMAHFYAIAIYRRDEYAAASLPVMAVKRGVPATKMWILAYVTAFIPLAALLTVTGRTGTTYLTVMLAVGLTWLWRALDDFRTGDDKRWARRMFGFSLIVILIFSLMMAVDAWLP